MKLPQTVKFLDNKSIKKENIEIISYIALLL